MVFYKGAVTIQLRVRVCEAEALLMGIMDDFQSFWSCWPCRSCIVGVKGVNSGSSRYGQGVCIHS